jgi:N-methylhydantoinase B
MATANSRVPKMVAGDLNAEVVGVRTGANALLRLVERHGLETFEECVERMFDHGEDVVRSYFERIPDGTYVGHGQLDNDGITDEAVPFEVVVEVSGSDVRIDYSRAPDALAGPFNAPLASTVSASRIAIQMLAGGNEAPNEGHFRATEVVVRPGSMFHPLSPSPTFLCTWSALQAIEVIYDAIAKALPEAVPAWSSSCLCALVWWGIREGTGEPWADGSPHPIGQGAHVHGDGASLIHVSEAATRFSPVEVWESRNPWVLERVELAPDSGGPGEHRGGLGVDMSFHSLENAYVTVVLERTKIGSPGLEGGLAGRPNSARIRYADGSSGPLAKATRLSVPKGATIDLMTGGGGGFGPPERRSAAAIARDVREGYATEEHAGRHYAQARAAG